MKLQISPKVTDDIAQIKKYICEECGSPATANRIAIKIVDSYERLETFPYIGKRLDGLYNIETDYRFLGCGSYLIFYTVGEEIVSVDRVIHGRRDYCKILFGNEITDDIPEDEQGV
jgi:plasmid stabilization system protein ParE